MEIKTIFTPKQTDTQSCDVVTVVHNNQVIAIGKSVILQPQVLDMPRSIKWYDDLGLI